MSRCVDTEDFKHLVNASSLYGTDEWVKVMNLLADTPTADVRENVHAENVAEDYADCDQFVCSNCGIELQDWVRVERDEDDGDITYHEYVFNFCPNCGADMRERRE